MNTKISLNKIIHCPNDEVTRLENYTFNTKKKQIVQYVYKRRKLDDDSRSITMNKRVVMDTQKHGILGVALVGLAITKATIHEVVDIIKTLQEQRENNTMIEIKLNHYKAHQTNMFDMINYFLNLHDDLNGVEIFIAMH